MFKVTKSISHSERAQNGVVPSQMLLGLPFGIDKNTKMLPFPRRLRGLTLAVHVSCFLSGFIAASARFFNPGLGQFRWAGALDREGTCFGI